MGMEKQQTNEIVFFLFDGRNSLFFGPFRTAAV